MGQYMQPDPIGLEGGNPTLYSYVSNPNWWIDPLGLERGVGNNSLSNDAIVVRGGQGSPENLISNQARDVRGHISANSGNGLSLNTLATSPNPFPNGQVSTTTVGKIRAIGMNVIPDPTIQNPNHVSIVPRNTPMSLREALELSTQFTQVPNIWR